MAEAVAPAASEAIAPVPVTILTGFLGSGKTTLLKRLLAGEHGHRIAVIENEFGDERGIERLIATDAAPGSRAGNAVARGGLVATDAAGEAVALDDLFVELSNGCICCTVRDDLVTTLEELLRRKAGKFDYIVVETTGVADPGPLAGIFWLDDDAALDSARLYLDGIVTMVDAKNLVRHLEDVNKQAGGEYVNEAEKQIAYADRVIVNKTDLVTDAAQLAAVQARVAAINPFAATSTAAFADVDVASVLDLRGFDAGKQLNDLQQELLTPGPGPGTGTGTDNTTTETRLGHDASVKSAVVRFAEPLDKRKLEKWLGALLWEGDAGGDPGEGAGEGAERQIFRMKGTVNIGGEPQVHVLQAVHETFEVEPSQVAWGAQEAFAERATKIVFIGRGIDGPALGAAIVKECKCDVASSATAATCVTATSSP